MIHPIKSVYSLTVWSILVLYLLDYQFDMGYIAEIQIPLTLFWLLFIPVIVAPFVVMHAIAKAKNSGIVITDRSVFSVESGTVKSVRLEDVVTVRDSGAGALTVTDRGGSKLTWEHLRNPSRAARQLRQFGGDTRRPGR